MLAVLALCLVGCLGVPDGARPVEDFALDKYLGKWYEIARLDHSFERGLEQVTAEYILTDDGGVSVINRGFSPAKNEWSEANGRASFVNDPDEGYLKVSFFGPFYGSYVIFDLDKVNYEYAFVSGPDFSYLWLLSRKKNISPEVMSRFIEESRQLGFNTKELIFVEHD